MESLVLQTGFQQFAQETSHVGALFVFGYSVNPQVVPSRSSLLVNQARLQASLALC